MLLLLSPAGSVSLCYAGQLNAYRDALEAAGERVLKKYLYYPVSGERVQIG